MMGLLVICMVWQVVSLYILQSPSIYTDELARFLLIWVSFLGAAFYSGQNLHVAIDILSNRLGIAHQLKIRVFVYVIIVLFVLCVFVIGGDC